ncbi:tetratricopeptide repeat protein [Oleiharenicola lentus]|uniref:tetratricopeptide repeat protein n=1 Tax=Oleiharenicola lentus TaxID=2508720 RepID=UPI003F66481F
MKFPRVIFCCLLLAAPALQAAEEFMADAEVLQRAPTLTIEERRYLVYLYARLNQAPVAQALAEQILKDNPSDRQTLLVLASMAVERKDPEAILRIAREFLRYYPGDHQGRYFLGAGHYLAKQYAQANEVLRELKHEQFLARKYPYETDLAASAYAAGDWYRAMLSYQELLRHHALGDDLRSRVRIVLDSLYREHLPRWDFGAYGTTLKNARVWRYTGGEAQHLSDSQWVSVNYTRDQVTIEEAPSLRATREERAEAVATLSTVYDRRWETDAWIGHSGEGLLGGARVSYRFANQREVSLDYSANERALDSLTLEALDGRQYRTNFTASWLIETDLTFVVRGHWREVYVNDRKLGRGSGVDLNLDYTLWRQGPRVSIGYRGSISSFLQTLNDPSPAAPIADPAGGIGSQLGILNNLVSRRINRHGIGLLITDNLADAWLYRLTAGVDYDFELSSTSWNSALALTFLPRKSIEMTAEAGYTSSASSSNAGSSASLLNFYVRIYH